LRLGWIVAAEAIVDQLAIIKGRADVSSASLTQLVVAELLASRGWDEHLVTLRAEHLRRRDMMLAALDRHLSPGALTVGQPNGGIYLWCRLASDIDATDLAREALASGVAIVAGESFYPDAISGSGRHELRLCFTSVAPSVLDEGIRRLAGVIRSPQLRQSSVAGTRVVV
jgi:DNA-binding transcriptional MocR family regulator